VMRNLSRLDQKKTMMSSEDKSTPLFFWLDVSLRGRHQL
jgi:hypothetical protein